MLYYGCRSWKLIASVSVGTCVFVYLLFVQILNVVLL